MRLNNQIHTANPLATLNNPNFVNHNKHLTLIQSDEIFNMKEGRDVKILIKKDIERTMQEYSLFKD